jgi:hypothetical protein
MYNMPYIGHALCGGETDKRAKEGGRGRAAAFFPYFFLYHPLKKIERIVIGEMRYLGEHCLSLSCAPLFPRALALTWNKKGALYSQPRKIMLRLTIAIIRDCESFH